MSGFVRPEVTTFWLRWRAVLLGVALLAFGLIYGLTNGGLLRVVGLGIAVGGLAWLWDSFRRARFPTPGGGPGVVDLVERRLRYFGPEWGGAVSLDELARVRVRASASGPDAPAMVWEFTDLEGQRLAIPSDAEGAHLIFDALTALPGADFEAAARVSAQGSNAGPVLIWARARGPQAGSALPRG